MAGLGFTEDGGRRVVAATEGWEAMPKNNPHTQFVGVPTTDDRWVILTDTDGFSGRYSWQSLEATASLDMTANANWLSANYDDDVNYAVASNGCKDCIIGHIVYLTPAKSQNYFLFDYDRHASAKAEGPISGRVGAAAGVGLVIPDILDGDTGQYNATSQSFPIYNPYQGTVEDGKVVQMHINGNVWELSGDDCIDDGT